MQFHAGQPVADATAYESYDLNQKVGQKCLHSLAEAILRESESEAGASSSTTEVITSLELDGYVYKNGALLAPESDVLDVKEEEGALQALYTSLALDEKETAFHNLELSETHYMEARWDDSISNSRKFLECVLTQSAAKHSLAVNSAPLTKTRPVQVREYLESEGLLEASEKEALAKVYGLLSHTGGHPYMAENDQARLLRHLALTFCQFVMLRLQGRLRTAT